MDETNENVIDEENKSAISADLIRGHINTIILRTLYERDKYGYEIIEEIEKKSHGQYSLKQPTLYSALKRLETQGYINAYWKTDEVSQGGRRKYYTLTDSGREITEKNQAEWEYSRTVIDNLISDRSFDFSQPAPTSVDFKILKKSTSRVPVIKDEADEDEDVNEEKSEKAEVKDSQLPKIEIKPETVTFTEQTVIYENVQAVKADGQQPTAPVEEKVLYNKENVQEESAPKRETHSEMNEEQRKIVHENFLRLISDPPAPEPPKEVDVVPVSDEIDTDKLIYNNKPETERNYKNLIDGLFNQTMNRNPNGLQQTAKTESPASDVRIEEISIKAEKDGIKLNDSEYLVATRKKSYNKGATLLKSSLIVSIVMLLEFAICLIFKNSLGVSIAYPFVIFALDAAQLLIFGVLYYTDRGKISRKPSTTVYLTASIVISVILIFIVFIVSLLLSVNFASVGDIMAKIIIPCLVALNIPLFAECFNAFSK